MSNTLKVILVVVVIAIIALVYWYSTSSSTPSVPSPTASSAAVTNSQGSTSVAPTTAEQDVAAIDAQLKALDSSSASIDAAINDKPVAQTE